MTTLTAHAYTGETDLAAMLALIRARPVARVLDFPSLYDLYELLGTASRRENTQLWLDADDRLLGFAIVDLNFNTMWAEVAASAPGEFLFSEMVAWGLARLRQPHETIHNAGVLQMSCRAERTERIAQLKQLGFVQQDWYTVQMTRSLDEPILAPKPPPGFIIRHGQGEEEAAAVAALHRAAFSTAAMTTENRLAMMRVPEYDQMLDWVAVAPDGALAAYVLGSISHEENTLAGIQRGYTDPVATHPDYQRRGLARALLLTGLHVFKARGMTEVVLGTSSRNQAMQATAQAVGYRITGKTVFFHRPL
ncbi:MAG: GNAT family N-acetyltransferase [Caldilineaceae bacterium]